MSAEHPDGPGRIGDGPRDDHPQWMQELDALDDTALDDLLAGTTPTGAAGLRPLAEVIAELRGRVGAPPPPVMSAALRAQIEGQLPARRRPARLLAGMAAAALVVVAMQGAASGALPDPVQQAVSRAASWVGLDLPDADDDEIGPEGSDGRGEDPRGAPGDDAPTREGGKPTVPLGPPVSTPGGAIPADPGGPGEPASPATPPTTDRPAVPDGPDTDPATPADPGDLGEPATPATPPTPAQAQANERGKGGPARG